MAVEMEECTHTHTHTHTHTGDQHSRPVLSEGWLGYLDQTPLRNSLECRTGLDEVLFTHLIFYLLVCVFMFSKDVRVVKCERTQNTLRVSRSASPPAAHPPNTQPHIPPGVPGTFRVCRFGAVPPAPADCA